MTPRTKDSMIVRQAREMASMRLLSTNEALQEQLFDNSALANDLQQAIAALVVELSELETMMQQSENAMVLKDAAKAATAQWVEVREGLKSEDGFKDAAGLSRALDALTAQFDASARALANSHAAQSRCLEWLLEVKASVDEDLLNKQSAHAIDSDCGSLLHPSNSPGTVMAVVSDSSPLLRSQPHSLLRWRVTTDENCRRSRSAIRAVSKLRARAREMLGERVRAEEVSHRQLMHQHRVAVAAIKRAVVSLEHKLATTKAKLQRLAEDGNAMEEALARQMDALALSEERLALRAKERPDLEKVQDHAQDALLEEVATGLASLEEIRAALERQQAATAELEQQQNELSERLSERQADLQLELSCLEVQILQPQWPTLHTVTEELGGVSEAQREAQRAAARLETAATKTYADPDDILAENKMHEYKQHENKMRSRYAGLTDASEGAPAAGAPLDRRSASLRKASPDAAFPGLSLPSLSTMGTERPSTVPAPSTGQWGGSGGFAGSPVFGNSVNANSRTSSGRNSPMSAGVMRSSSFPPSREAEDLRCNSPAFSMPGCMPIGEGAAFAPVS